MPRQRATGVFDAREFAAFATDYMSNPKTFDLSPAAKVLDWSTVLMSVAKASDGVVIKSSAVAEAGIGVNDRHARELTEHGRWHEFGHDCLTCPQPPSKHHVVIHDFDQHQRTSKERAELSKVRSKNGSLGNHSKYNHSGPIEECDKCNPPSHLRAV